MGADKIFTTMRTILKSGRKNLKGIDNIVFAEIYEGAKEADVMLSTQDGIVFWRGKTGGMRTVGFRFDDGSYVSTGGMVKIRSTAYVSVKLVGMGCHG